MFPFLLCLIPKTISKTLLQFLFPGDDNLIRAPCVFVEYFAYSLMGFSNQIASKFPKITDRGFCGNLRIQEYALGCLENSHDMSVDTVGVMVDEIEPFDFCFPRS